MPPLDMRAVVYERTGERPTVTRIPVPECPADGALVRVEATGVCRSDWHAWRGHDPVALPHVPGHEYAGVVAEVGAEVHRFSPGDRVTAPFVNGCGRCEWCLSGQAQVCPDQTQPGFTHPGSFAEYVVVRAADTNLVAIPDSVDAVAAASLGCRFATAYRAVTAHGRVDAGTEVAVFGCGGVGLSAVMIATALGATVTAVDVSPAALERARVLGAAHTVDATRADAEEAIGRATSGGAHVTIDAIGSAATAQTAIRSLRRRGTHVQVGLMFGESEEAALPWGRVIAWELSIIGSHGMPGADYPALLDLVRAGRLRPELLLGSTVDLDGAVDALVAMDDPQSSSGIVVARLDAPR
ncbi:zinc-dependent alcohol dehydrogenase family protein [Microbacterium algeriense]|nr:zinc-dependent alcohol dehydrogenase family protein [Microbacterium algeriense]MDX2400237.1 zinc-dependent alcohol dehydrogenase family protein [Microbacterium algeriense]